MMTAEEKARLIEVLETPPSITSKKPISNKDLHNWFTGVCDYINRISNGRLDYELEAWGVVLEKLEKYDIPELGKYVDISKEVISRINDFIINPHPSIDPTLIILL